MKFVLHLMVLTLGAVSLVAAQEFQVDSATATGYSGAPGEGFTFTERIDGKYSYPFDLNGGGFDFKAHVNAGYPDGFGANIDVLSATLVFKKPAEDLVSLKWVLGRFGVTEPTGLILNHPGDGSKLTLNYGLATLNVTTAFTGLNFRSASDISLTQTDQSLSDDLLASPRFIGALDASFKIFESHQLSLGALAQQDLNSRDKYIKEWSTTPDSEKGGALDTQYLTLAGTGPIVDSLFYNAFVTLGTGSTLSLVEDKNSTSGSVYQYKPVLGFLGGGSLAYFLPEFYSSSFSGRLLVASGDGDAASSVEGNTKGDYNLFVPLTATTLGTVFNPGLSNLIYYELGATAKPVTGLPLVLGTKLLGFQRAVSGVVNASGVLRTGPIWLGEELDVTATWKPYSDLTVNGSLGAFVPTAKTYAANSSGDGVQFAFNVGANLSL